jgi:hypothetical protein
MTVKLSALRADLSLLPRKILWYTFLLEAELTPDSKRLAKLKKLSDLIGNRNHDLPACGRVLPATTLSRAAHEASARQNLDERIYFRNTA